MQNIREHDLVRILGHDEVFKVLLKMYDEVQGKYNLLLTIDIPAKVLWAFEDEVQKVTEKKEIKW